MDDVVDIKAFEETFTINIISEIAQKYDEFLIDCFAKCGISKDYVFKHSHEFRSTSYLGNDTRTYYWNDKKLFTVYIKNESTTNSENKQVSVCYKAKILAEFWPNF